MQNRGIDQCNRGKIGIENNRGGGGSILMFWNFDIDGRIMDPSRGAALRLCSHHTETKNKRCMTLATYLMSRRATLYVFRSSTLNSVGSKKREKKKITRCSIALGI